VDESVEIVDSPALLARRPCASLRHGGEAQVARRASANGMDEVDVGQAQIVEISADDGATGVI
jgi:hypothetical protein